MRELNEFWPFILKPSYFALEDFTLFSFEGADSARFLNGHLTQDMNLVTSERAQYSARLNNKGQIQSWQILFVSRSLYHALVPSELAQGFKTDLEKFIIMDDVEIVLRSEKFAAVIGAAITKYPPGPLLLYKGLPVKLMPLQEVTDATKISAPTNAATIGDSIFHANFAV